MAQVVHLDANILIPILWDRDPELEPTSKALVKRLRGEVKSQPNREVKIPKLTVGEVLNKYFEDLNGRSVSSQPNRNGAFISSLNEVITDLEANVSSIQTECWKVARKLKRKDRFLEHNDLFIASMAIQDNDSTHLLTRDSDLIETTAIKDVCRERSERNHGLTVGRSF
jgi:predicted nucleic acid-binding protein